MWQRRPSHRHTKRVSKEGEGVWLFWTIVYDAINHLGDDIDRLQELAKMIRSLSKLPDVVDDHGEMIKSDINGQVFWRDVPGVAFYFGDTAMGQYESEIEVVLPTSLVVMTDFL